VEILLNKPRIADLIKKGEVDMIKEAMEQLTTDGLQTFDQALFDLYKNDIVSYEEALVNSDSANNLRLKMKTAGLPIPGEENVSAGFALEENKPVEPQGGMGRRPKMKR
jgi:twitching motility protein PilU